MFGFRITPCGTLAYRACFCHPHTGFTYWPLPSYTMAQAKDRALSETLAW